MRLAARFGVPVKRAAEMIDAREFAEWMAAEAAGILDNGAWRRMARICSTIGRVNGAKVTEEQFMPRPAPRPEQPEAKMKAAISAIFGAPEMPAKEA